MWIFLSGGLIMPSQAPIDEADSFMTDGGRRQIQVRARLTEHLEYFIRNYQSAVSDDFSEIEQTPHMDYNCRYYTTHEAFAEAMKLAVSDIDYRKFKPTAEGIDPTTGKMFKSGKRYHSLLNRMWGLITMLAPAGGSWGPRSATNPNGYDSAESYFEGSDAFEDHKRDLQTRPR